MTPAVLCSGDAAGRPGTGRTQIIHSGAARTATPTVRNPRHIGGDACLNRVQGRLRTVSRNPRGSAGMMLSGPAPAMTSGQWILLAGGGPPETGPVAVGQTFRGSPCARSGGTNFRGRLRG